MKLNLLWGDGPEYGESYTNINPFLQMETANCKRGNVQDLSRFADDGEVSELIALDVIDYLDTSKVVPVIEGWVKKLAHGGTIIIGGTDMYEVCRLFSHYKINLLQVNALLHGDGSKPYLIKKTQFTLKGLADLLAQLGLKIMKKRLDQETLQMVVEAQRI